jgi:hypothetical protein
MVGTHKDSKGRKDLPTFEIENFGKPYGLHTQQRENTSVVLQRRLPVGKVPISRKP